MSSKQKQTVVWKHGGSNVFISGKFNDWGLTKMEASNNIFSASVPVNDGQFKFVVDNKWQCSPDYFQEPDANGNINNVLTKKKK